MLAACSVGRVLQDGARDVEGLYAELAAHYGRAVIAARWPIADTETATFVDEFVRQYCASRATVADDAGVPFTRARALNAARRGLLERGEVSLHLASAFEIYGLG